MSALPLTRSAPGRHLPRPPVTLRLLTGEAAPRGRPARTGWRLLTPLVTIAAAGLVAVLLTSHGHAFSHALGRALAADWKLVAAGALLEAASVGSYVLLLHRVVSSASPRLRRRDSLDITLAGTAAARLLPTAGLGGAAVTVWALRARGVQSREIAERLIAFLVLLYGVYMGALVVCGGAVACGLVHVTRGRPLGPVAALIGGGVAAAAIAVAFAPAPLARALRRLSGRSPRLAPALSRIEANLPTLRAAFSRSLHELRRPHPALLGAVAWWAFDIAVLFSMLHAFGASPVIPVLVLAYFIGTLFNVLPLPGSLSGGLVGVLIALGTPAGASIAAVLAYRAMAVWLPAASGLPSIGRLRAAALRWRGEARPSAVRA